MANGLSLYYLSCFILLINPARTVTAYSVRCPLFLQSKDNASFYNSVATVTFAEF